MSHSLISAAIAPIIYKVEGCTNVLNTTTLCPTSGFDADGEPIELTITGTNFFGQLNCFDDVLDVLSLMCAMIMQTSDSGILTTLDDSLSPCL